jgi:hypothetical protein
MEFRPRIFAEYRENHSKNATESYENSDGLLRWRVKRIIVYMNKLIVSGLATRDEKGESVIYDLEKRIKEFHNIIKNYFEGV